MKVIVTISITILLLSACSTQKMQDQDRREFVSAPVDSAGADTLAYGDEAYEDSLQNTLETALEQVAITWEENAVYELNGSYNGYENSSDARYYFDSLMQLTHCTVNWAAEGSEGNYSYYFKGDQLYALREENMYDNYEETVLLHAAFSPLYGLMVTNGASDDFSISYLREDDYLMKQSDAVNEYRSLLGRILQLQDSVEEDEGAVTIRVEENLEGGNEFKSTEEFIIDKKLFDAIRGESLAISH